MTNTTITPLICGECGEGNYVASTTGAHFPVGHAGCAACGKVVSIEHDLFPFLDAEETIIERDGIVCVVSS